MFTHILVALDGSAFGERVLDYAVDLARPSAARVTLLTVVPEAPGHAGGPSSAQLDTAREYLEGHAEALRHAGLGDATSEVRVGSSVDAIVEVARELDADLIAMTTQGVGAAGEERVGSVAAAVLTRAPCPVFMVRVRRPAPARDEAEERWQAEGGGNIG